MIDVVASDDDVIQQVAFLGGCNGKMQSGWSDFGRN